MLKRNETSYFNLKKMILKCLIGTLLGVCVGLLLFLIAGEVDGNGIIKYMNLQEKGQHTVTLLTSDSKSVYSSNGGYRGSRVKRKYLGKEYYFTCSVVVDGKEYEFTELATELVGVQSGLKYNSLAHSKTNIEGYIFINPRDDSVYFSKEPINAWQYFFKQLKKHLSSASAKQFSITCALIGVGVVVDKLLKEHKIVAKEKARNKKESVPTRKKYPNELCSCGSGKKYKKCCGKKG